MPPATSHSPIGGGLSFEQSDWSTSSQWHVPSFVMGENGSASLSRGTQTLYKIALSPLLFSLASINPTSRRERERVVEEKGAPWIGVEDPWSCWGFWSQVRCGGGSADARFVYGVSRSNCLVASNLIAISGYNGFCEWVDVCCRSLIWF